MPSFSVVMPTYNRAATIERAINSVLAQRDVEAELVVVDDGSTDDTAAIIEKYRNRLVYLRLDRQRGGNFARNRGIERAQGEIISFIDSDDEFLPRKLKYVGDYFAAHPDVDVLIDSFETYYPEGRKRRSALRRNPVLNDNTSVREAIFGREIYKATPAISARRRALIEVGLFDETLTRRQDMDLLLRLTQSHNCASTDQVLWIKHWTAGAISSKKNTFLAATIEICQRHPIYLSEPHYSRGLHRDLGRHFWQLLRGARFADLRHDLALYRAFGKFGASPWLLVLKYLKLRGQGLIAPR